MNIKTTPQMKNLIFLCLMAIGSFSYAQVSQTVSAPVSELKLNDKGEIACTIHANDQEASLHHSMGSSESVLTAKSKDKITIKSKKGPTGAQIFVDYYNFDPSFSMEDFIVAATSFQSAIDIWASTLSSDVPIFVAAVFEPLDSGVLGSAGPTFIYNNIEGLETDTWYGNALADKLTGQDLSPEAYDIIARFSTVFPNWYFGTDGNTPDGDYDFRSVVLHELGHGLGFFGSMFVDNASGLGSYGFGSPIPAIYDRLAYSADGKSILKENRYGNNSAELGSLLLSGPLTSKGPNTKKATSGKGAEIFTIVDSEITGPIAGLTDVWLPGSSYSHLDFFTYVGSNNGLMVPFLSRGVAFENPGPIVLAMFDDMGWNGKVNREVQENNGNKGIGDEPSAIASKSTMILSPNPFINTVQLDLGTEKRSISKATVLDVNGIGSDLPSSSIQGSSNITIDMSSFKTKSDLYFLKVTFDSGETETFKLYRGQ